MIGDRGYQLWQGYTWNAFIALMHFVARLHGVELKRVHDCYYIG